MDDKELIHLLQSHRPQAPVSPAGEWQAILQKTQPLRWAWQRFFGPRWALGAGLSLATLALVVVPLLQPVTTALDDESLEPYLTELHQGLSASQAASSGSYGEEYLALLSEAD